MSAKLRRWFRPCLEALEDRCLPSALTFTVTNLKDDGSAGSLRKRVEAANNHPGADIVVFKPGLTGTIKLFSGQIPICGGLTLLGPGASVVAVDGNANDRIFNIDDGTVGATSSVTIKGLELRNGKANSGGAIFSNENLTLIQDVIDGNQAIAAGGISAGGNLTIKKSTISGNTATATPTTATDAGGVYFAGTTLTVKGSTISGNTATTGAGGGLYLYSGAATISKSLIAGNVAGGGSGGGIFAGSGVTSLTVTGSTLFANRSSISGGGVHSYVGPMTITKCTIANNTATGSGGGVTAFGLLTISASRISDNTSDFTAGGINAVGSAALTLTNSTVSGNLARHEGGGLFRAVGPSTVTGCTFSGNQAEYGGAISVHANSSFTLSSSTLSGNRATKQGGAIYDLSAALVVHNSTIVLNQAGLDSPFTSGGIFANASVTLESSIVALNLATGIPSDLATDSMGAAFTATRCLIDNLGTGTVTIDDVTEQLKGLDPLLLPLADNGGPTQTHALRKGSPCIDQGDNPDNLATDQRGPPFARKLGHAVDIGAYERQ